LLIVLFQEQPKVKEKYGHTLDRQDLSVLDWIEHAQQELQDGILYLEKLKQTLKGNKFMEPQRRKILDEKISLL
jgi:hypothetical protein